MSEIAQYLCLDDVPAHLREMADALGSTDVIAVRNLGFIPQPRDYYILAPHTPLPVDNIYAFAVDMDGTSTTTEPLALHGLEYMVRRVTNHLTEDQWPGLDAEKDIPYVIGNSNFRHTEFLLTRYADAVDDDAFCTAFIETLLWTLAHMTDHARREDVILNAKNCGLGAFLHDETCAAYIADASCTEEMCATWARELAATWRTHFAPPHFTARVAAALDIYYYRYHAILQQMQEGDSREIARALLHDENAKLVAPMPGYGVFLCLIKGWLSPEGAAALAPHVRACHATDSAPRDDDASRLAALAAYFTAHPACISLVTASIAFEAHCVMKEVIRLVREDAAAWPIPEEDRARIAEHTRDYLQVFDGFVTASDASEARLKPHRDLYSIALHDMAVPREHYSGVMAIEDTEPGILSARAAGCGIAVALPNHDTSQQNYAKASAALRGGLPELLLDKRLYLSETH